MFKTAPPFSSQRGRHPPSDVCGNASNAFPKPFDGATSASIPSDTAPPNADAQRCLIFDVNTAVRFPAHLEGIMLPSFAGPAGIHFGHKPPNEAASASAIAYDSVTARLFDEASKNSLSLCASGAPRVGTATPTVGGVLDSSRAKFTKPRGETGFIDIGIHYAKSLQDASIAAAATGSSAPAENVVDGENQPHLAGDVSTRAGGGANSGAAHPLPNSSSRDKAAKANEKKAAAVISAANKIVKKNAKKHASSASARDKPRADTPVASTQTSIAIIADRKARRDIAHYLENGQLLCAYESTIDDIRCNRAEWTNHVDGTGDMATRINGKYRLICSPVDRSDPCNPKIHIKYIKPSDKQNNK